LALAIAGVPRGTADVDLNVFVEPPRLVQGIDALRGVGVDVARACWSPTMRDGAAGSFPRRRWDEINQRFRAG
jgi:hypothetical protein